MRYGSVCSGETDKLKVLDLFSGIGSYALGVKRAGANIVSLCEIDPWCQSLLTQNFPETPIISDVKEAEFDQIEADIIIGGFPCQDISNAGKRAGIAGERSGLFWEMVRAIRVVRPKLALLENVADLLNRGRGMGVVLGAMADVGYDAEWDCISCSDLGAPHGRNRVWIAATDRDNTDFTERTNVSVQRRERLQQDREEVSSNADGERELQPPWLLGKIRRWLDNGDVRAFWSSNWQTKFEALRGMDVRAPTRLDRSRDRAAIGHLGNCNPPQVPEFIIRAFAEESGMT